jgi:hypothetical protein
MPGHLISAKCSCGYQTSLWPGSLWPGSASVRSLNVIAYSTDQSDLITVELTKAKKSRLKIIEDPALCDDFSQRDIRFPLFRGLNFDSGWGPYLCPSCKELKLKMILEGHWD